MKPKWRDLAGRPDVLLEIAERPELHPRVLCERLDALDTAWAKMIEKRIAALEASVR